MGSMDFQRRTRADARVTALFSACFVGSLLSCDASGAAPRALPQPTLQTAAADSNHASAALGAEQTNQTPPARPPAPAQPAFVLLLHGLGGSGRNLTRHFAFDSLSRTLDFEFEAPDGAVDSEGRRFWNAGESCCDFEKLGPDHVRSLGAILTRERERGKRVFVVGYSNGGFMAHRLACDVEGIAGVLSVAGPSPMDVSTCKHAAPRVLHVHGDADPVVRFEGGGVFDSARRHASAEASILGWAQRRGCDAALTTTAELDLDPSLPGDETLVQRASCAPDLTLYRVRGGVHNVIQDRTSAELLTRALLE